MTTRKIHLWLCCWVLIRLTRWNLFPRWRVGLIEQMYELRSNDDESGQQRATRTAESEDHHGRGIAPAPGPLAAQSEGDSVPGRRGQRVLPDVSADAGFARRGAV